MGLTSLGGSPAAAVAAAAKGKRDDLRPTPATPTFTLSSSVRNIAWMNATGDVIYGYGSGTFRQSLDDGVTWTDVYTFPAGYAVHGVRDLDDGELLVSLWSTTANAAGTLWRSTGYVKTNPTAATWTNVLTCSGATQGNYIEGAWGMSTYRNIAVVSEYGANKTTPNNARYAYLSTNFGANFSQIFDLGTTTAGHIHGVCYDPYDERIWLVHGDGASARGIRYSDNNGANWRLLSTDYQPTGVIALPNCVLMVSDEAPNGVYRIPRTNKDDIPEIEVAYRLDESATLTYAGSQLFRARTPGSPVLLPFINSGTGTRPGLILATQDGYNFHELWRDTISYANTFGAQRVVGPTASGKIVGSVKDGRQANYSYITGAAPTWG